MMQIREVREQDSQAWSLMRTALWPDTEDQHRAEIQAYFDGTSHDVEMAVVAVLDTEIVGFMELNIRNFAEGSRSSEVPYIEAWYVRPEYQGRGLGRQLMDYAEDWAARAGYQELASDTEIDNARSIDLHKQLGFEETDRVVCFLKRLEKD